MKETLKSLQILAKVLARSSNAMWDILLTNEEEAKRLAGIVLTTRSVRLQTDYMGLQKIRMILQGVPMNLTEERLGTSPSSARSRMSPPLKPKTGIATEEYVLQGVMSRKDFNDILNILTCRDRNMLVVVKGRRFHCWTCGAARHMAKMRPTNSPDSLTAAKPGVSGKAGGRAGPDLQ